MGTKLACDCVLLRVVPQLVADICIRSLLIFLTNVQSSLKLSENSVLCQNFHALVGRIFRAYYFNKAMMP